MTGDCLAGAKLTSDLLAPPVPDAFVHNALHRTLLARLFESELPKPFREELVR